MISHKIKNFQPDNTNKSRWLMSFADLFLSILCFFIILNVNSNQSIIKNKELLNSLKNEFKNKTVGEKINEVSGGRKADSIAGFNQSVYEQINQIIVQFKPQVNLNANYYNNSIEVSFVEGGVVNIEDGKFRQQAKMFFAALASKINEFSIAAKIPVKIIAYKTQYNGVKQLDAINKIHSIFERANTSNYPLEFFLMKAEQNNDTIKIQINVTKN
jgi:flagellar motor protein MotB